MTKTSVCGLTYLIAITLPKVLHDLCDPSPQPPPSPPPPTPHKQWLNLCMYTIWSLSCFAMTDIKSSGDIGLIGLAVMVRTIVS